MPRKLAPTCSSTDSSLLLVLRRYGRIPLIHGKGEWGRAVTKLIKRNRKASDDAVAAKRFAKRVAKKKEAGMSAMAAAKAAADAAKQDPEIGWSTTPSIGRILFLDRTVDPISPLLTQATYEGLLDELVSIRFRTLLSTSEQQ